MKGERMREAGGRVVALAAVVAVAAAGCGGSGTLSKSDYEKELKSKGTELRNDLRGLDLQNTNNLKALAPKLDSVHKQIGDAADEIDDLKPPKDAQSDNDKIAKSLHQFADIFGKMSDAAAHGDRAKVVSYVSKLSSAAQEGSAAAQDLKAKGYDIGEFGQ